MCSHEPDVLHPTLPALEREITELASHIHAATCRWLCLVAEYDRREGWASWSCRSCAHWVSWRCGVALVAAREHVRVARRLDSMPLVREAFAEGRLSYSKVRALTRVDGVEREAELLELAQHATASQLDRVVRAYRGVVAAEHTVRGGRPERWLTWSHDDDGSLLLQGRLPAEEGALLIAAVEAAATAGPPDTPAGASPSISSDARDTPAGESAVSASEARADALLLVADSFLATGPTDRSGGDRHQVVLHVDAPTLRTRERGERCELEDGAPLAADTARRLACDAAIVPLLERAGKPIGVGRKTRSIPPALRRALMARDRGCRFPGCEAHRFVDAHHIELWADGGPTDLGNLVHLCRHHHRLLHEGGYAITRTAKGTLTFRRPDGRAIPACPTPPAGRLTGIRARTERRQVAPDACVPLSGDRLDLHLGVQAMLTFAPPGAMAPGV
jgi:Domain of unknown function (DUF222)